MLELDSGSEEVAYLKKRAAELAHIATSNSASISGAIGVDLCSCDMNCKFCSFGTEWGLIEEDVIYSKEEIIRARARLRRGGRHHHHLALDRVLRPERAVRVAGRHPRASAGKLPHQPQRGRDESRHGRGGLSGRRYERVHVIRMREGIDTPFDVDLRWKTVDAISNSPLRWLTCIEPLGIEHTNEEIADRILENLAHHPYAMSVMARVNVPGHAVRGNGADQRGAHAAPAGHAAPVRGYQGA